MITLALIVINVVIYFYSLSHSRVIERYILSEGNIRQHHQWYRVLTSGFLHGSPIHLLFNMYALFSFGASLESNTSILFFCTIYFASILAGSLFSLYLHWGEHSYRALGASGGVTGIIFASVLLLNSSVGLIFLPFYVPGYIFAILFFFGSFLFGAKKNSGIAHDAHVGGALVGCILSALFYGTFFETKSILILLFSGIAVTVWIWHEKLIREAIVFLGIFLLSIGGIAWHNSWNIQSLLVTPPNPAIAYYQGATLAPEEKEILSPLISDEQFIIFLKYSLSLGKSTKIKIINTYGSIDEKNRNELKTVINSEAKEFVALGKGEFADISQVIAQKQKDWGEILICVKEKKFDNCDA